MLVLALYSLWIQYYWATLQDCLTLLYSSLFCVFRLLFVVVSLARDIISGAGMTTSSLSLLSHSMALEEMDSYARVGAATPGSGRRQSVGSRPYLQNSYSKPKGETGASVSAGPGSTTLLLSDRDSVDAPPASSSNCLDQCHWSCTLVCYRYIEPGARSKGEAAPCASAIGLGSSACTHLYCRRNR